jgi:hypothetical protein
MIAKLKVNKEGSLRVMFVQYFLEVTSAYTDM